MPNQALDQKLIAPELPQLQELLGKIGSKTVLCIGDLMLDKFLYGDVERVSPEAPIPVLKVTRESFMLGGAGNAAANMVSLGAQTIIAGIVGEDEAAQTIKTLSTETFGAADMIISDPARPTTVKARYVASSQQLLRCDWEDSKEVAPTVHKILQKKLGTAIAKSAAVLISDYGKGLLSEDLCQFIITTAKQNNIPVIVDPKGKDYSKYRGATIIKPNKKELAEATDMKLENDRLVVEACNKLIKELDINAVVATRGKEGMSLIHKNGLIAHIPSITRDVFDVSGAGDSVAAVLTTCLAVDPDMHKAAILGNLAGNIVVGKAGTAKIHKNELQQILIDQFATSQKKNAVSGLEKLFNWENAQEKIHLWQSQNLKVGFTNGCFDLVHPGHLSLIEQARRHCDRLVIGLNADSSVQRLKGASRPIQSENDRAAVLGSLSNVDMVVIFDQDTPMELLQTLRPDLLVKGSDYTIDKVVGAEFVQSYGGSVFLADLKDGFSTTKTVQKMAG